MLPVSSLLAGYAGISGVCLSVPSVIGRAGVSQPTSPADYRHVIVPAIRGRAAVRDSLLDEDDYRPTGLVT